VDIAGYAGCLDAVSEKRAILREMDEELDRRLKRVVLDLST